MQHFNAFVLFLSHFIVPCVELMFPLWMFCAKCISTSYYNIFDSNTQYSHRFTYSYIQIVIRYTYMHIDYKRFFARIECNKQCHSLHFPICIFYGCRTLYCVFHSFFFLVSLLSIHCQRKFFFCRHKCSTPSSPMYSTFILFIFSILVWF